MRFILTARLLLLLLLFPQWGFGWGYSAHRIVNRQAVGLLDSPLGEYFNRHINYLSEHAIDPDLWRNDKEAYPDEAHGHYFDADLYAAYPFRNIPRRWEEAVRKYGEKNLKGWGTAPWRIEQFYDKLVMEFKEGKWTEARLTAAALAHYVSDIHVPFHTVQNYNGQLTGNKGVHKRWEADMVEQYFLDAARPEGPLEKEADPVEMAFVIVEESFPGLERILKAETRARQTVPEESRDIIANWDKSMQGTEYIKILYEETGELAIARMKAASLRVASYWQWAWMEAGRPLPPAR
ncbi:MAG: hypothetical protein VX822_05830 [Candidatus Neomarinimicrobiota bacterium]|nr:hypothetical protein [Candidatus Neomarinimicrobiota bacterium]